MPQLFTLLRLSSAQLFSLSIPCITNVSHHQPRLLNLLSSFSMPSAILQMLFTCWCLPWIWASQVTLAWFSKERRLMYYYHPFLLNYSTLTHEFFSQQRLNLIYKFLMFSEELQLKRRERLKIISSPFPWRTVKWGPAAAGHTKLGLSCDGCSLWLFEQRAEGAEPWGRWAEGESVLRVERGERGWE